VGRILVCGLALDVCVAWTALDAVAAGFEAVVLRDLSRPVTAEGGERAVEEMARAGVVVAGSRDLEPP
jgi:nicotinamidase/pyrazinamidase